MRKGNAAVDEAPIPQDALERSGAAGHGYVGKHQSLRIRECSFNQVKARKRDDGVTYTAVPEDDDALD